VSFFHERESNRPEVWARKKFPKKAKLDRPKTKFPEGILVAPVIPPDKVVRSPVHAPLDPMAVASVGFKKGDAISLELVANGCYLSASRAGQLLRWNPGGLGRTDGKTVYLPYVTTLDHADHLARVMAELSGYCLGRASEKVRSKSFVLGEESKVSRRLIAGDEIRFDLNRQSLEVRRSQGTLDMHLYVPGSSDPLGLIMCTEMKYLTMQHHTHVVARVLVEINGLGMKFGPGGCFSVVNPRI
jgi:hypothetical protein